MSRDLTTLSRCLAAVKDMKDELIAYAPRPHDFMEGILTAYIDSMPNDTNDEYGEAKSCEGDLSIIETAISTIEKFFTKANTGHMAIYEICGICPEWRATEQVCQGIKMLIVMLKDILCLAMQGTSMLAEAHFLEELAYQKGVDMN